LGRDFFAGLLFIVFGALALAIGTRYPLGSTARMGAGYFPVLISGLLMFIGIVVAARGVRIQSTVVTPLSLKPLLLVLAAILLFAGTIERLGLTLAVLVVVVIGYLANARWRKLELFTLALILTAG